jgi:hypothetical protein
MISQNPNRWLPLLKFQEVNWSRTGVRFYGRAILRAGIVLPLKPSRTESLSRLVGHMSSGQRVALSANLAFVSPLGETNLWSARLRDHSEIRNLLRAEWHAP